MVWSSLADRFLEVAIFRFDLILATRSVISTVGGIIVANIDFEDSSESETSDSNTLNDASNAIYTSDIR